MTRSRLAFVCLIGILFLSIPTFYRLFILEYQSGGYQAPEVPPLDVGVTPIPTVTPNTLTVDVEQTEHLLPTGPIVVDLAHFNRLNRSQFQPLASALAQRGFGLQFWQSDVDPLQVENFSDFPDQSTELAELLKDASGLVIISPYFLWSPAEIAMVERFVQDGGRLVLISDPDIVGDVARDINNIGEPFGVVFNEDYLYDTTENDENHTHIFLKTFQNQATQLTENIDNEPQIAFYGTRSIGGAVMSQMRGGDTTLSSIRIGLNRFTTVALGGLQSNRTSGDVLAMSDFNVLTEPYVDRHDNRLVLDFVADFLTSSQREASIADFPDYLGRQVSLVYGSQSSVDAALLKQSANLQQQLETTGRTLELVRTAKLTETAVVTSSIPSSTSVPNTQIAQSTSLLADLDSDLIYLTSFEMAVNEPILMDRLGLTLIEIEEIPEVTEVGAADIPVEPLDGPSTPEIAPSLSVSEAETLSETTPLSATTTITSVVDSNDVISATTLVTTTEPIQPQITQYIETEQGLRILASETIFIVQQPFEDAYKLVAVLASDAAGIDSGVERLLNSDFSDCVLQVDQAICPVESNRRETQEVKPELEISIENDDAEDLPQPEPNGATELSDGQILVLDDNARANEDELSEAAFYTQILTSAGHTPTLWRTDTDGIPDQETLLRYRWVIWSSGNYAAGGPELENLNTIFDYISEGGRISISSQKPFFGESIEEPSPISDIVIVSDGIPELITGFPNEPIPLDEASPPVIPLDSDPESSPDIVLRRGPNSDNPDAPLLFVLTDVDEPTPTGARLLVLALSIDWLPEEYAELLVLNLAEWMLGE